MSDKYSMEEKLLLLAGRITHSHSDKKIIEEIIRNNSFNWYYFIGMAIKNKVLLIAFQSLKLSAWHLTFSILVIIMSTIDFCVEPNMSPLIFHSIIEF